MSLLRVRLWTVCGAPLSRQTTSQHNCTNEAMLRELADGIDIPARREDNQNAMGRGACWLGLQVFCGGIEIENIPLNASSDA